MARQFDVVVIGTGTAASTVASTCRSAGWQIAVIDSLPFGGTCALRGCDPKRVLLGAAEAVDWARRMKGKGLSESDLRLDWRDLIRFKRSFTDPVPQNREEGFRQAGIRTFHGRARFVGTTTIQVDEDVFDGRYVVIATGAKPRKLNISGEEHITTSDQFLELESSPRRITFIGGGYISMEFAHVSLRTNRDVTVLHRGRRLLEGFDPDLVEQLSQKTQHLGVKINLQAEVQAVERSEVGLRIHAKVAGDQKTFDTDLVVHGAGRARYRRSQSG